MAHPYPSEKKLLGELLVMYRDSTVCLWNPSHPGYTNKVSRRKAIESLLVKFRELDPTADAYRLKKKIDNMRTTYKRERIKVVRSGRGAGGAGRYVPTLWYYPLMRFLDELEPALADDAPQLADTHADHSIDHADHSIDPADDDDSEHTGSDSSQSQHKKAITSTVYITDEVPEYEAPSPAKVRRLRYSSGEEEPPYRIHSPAPAAARRAGPAAAGAGADLFGRAMAARLNHLPPRQRYIAEKLISDVIFLGRLNKLKTGSTININDDT